MVALSAANDEHRTCLCALLLALLRLQFPAYSSLALALALLLWQEDLLAVVRFVNACSAFRSRLREHATG